VNGLGTEQKLRALAVRRPTSPARFRVVVSACCVALSVGVALALLARSGHGLWITLLVLGALFVVAEHRDRLFSDETGLSGSIAVAMAAAVYFGANGWVGGSFLVCIAGGLYLPHLRAREWTKISVNSASFGLSGAAAAAVVTLWAPAGASPLMLALLGLPATVVYWAANSFLLAVATSSLRGGSVWPSTWELIRSDTVMLVFAVGGALCGVVMTEVGPWVGIVALVAVLVSLDVFVISVPAGPAVLWSAWRMALARLVAGAVAGFGAAGVAVAVGGDPLGGFVALGAGIALGLTAAVMIAIVRLVPGGGELDVSLLAGFAVAELPLVILASSAGVIGAEVGAAAGLLTASALVIVVSVLAAWRRHRDRPVPVDDAVLLAAVTEAIIDGMPDTLSQR
jgi:hypothetical protein